MIEELYNENIVDSPDDIEQVIEGGEDRARYSSGEEENGNENKKSEEDKKKDDEGDKKTKVRRKLGPRMVLNAERLVGPRGIGIMESFFSDLKLHGKGRERDDLEVVMKRLEHWAHRLAPRLQFDDCLKKIEKLGSKKEVANRVKRIRLDLDIDDDVVRDDGAENAPNSPPPPEDPFDQLMGRSVAAPPNTDMTAEQREQMLRNRLIAEERRAARIKKAQEMKLKFQEKLLNSQNVNSQSVDLPTPVGDEIEAESENMVVRDVEDDELGTKNNDDSANVAVNETNEDPEENVPSEDVEFNKMLVDVEEN